MSTNILNPFEIFADGEVPIMSFQTNKNGTFNPSMPVASGTLKWIIDGTEYITNTPSVALIGDTVDVEVFANTVPEGVVLNNPTFNSQNIIGEYSLGYFLVTGIVNAGTNLLMTSLPYSEFANVSSGVALFDTGVTIQDFSNVLLTGGSTLNNNEFTSVIFKNVSQSWSVLRLQGNNLTSLDLSDITFTGGDLLLQDNPITSLILNNVDSQLITTLNLTNIDVTSLNLSNYKMTAQIRGFNLPVVNYTPPTDYGSGLTLHAMQTAALNLTSVDLFFEAMDDWFSVNAPTANLVAATNLGTSASPTGGSSNTNLAHLRDVVYPAASKTFTALIN